MKNYKNKYLVVFCVICAVFIAVGCGTTQFTDANGATTLLPIAKDSFGKGGSLDFLVYPMAWLMNFIGVNLVNRNYALTILIATIFIRSLAWPIYGKTNDMSIKMQLIGPEQRKIEERYAGKVDKESQQRKSMELMQLYKKYKISFSGCIMPFLQMPIFLAFYETLRRIPVSSQNYIDSLGEKGNVFMKGDSEIVIGELLYDADKLNTDLFGIDLAKTASESEGNPWQKWGVYLIAALVGITQIGTQLLTQRRTNKQKNSLEAGVPDYRKKGASDQQKQTERMMKIMLYSMPVIMVVFIIQSPAALGWYWLVGNLYTAFQGYISSKTSAKKLEKLREKFNQRNYIS